MLDDELKSASAKIRSEKIKTKENEQSLQFGRLLFNMEERNLSPKNGSQKRKQITPPKSPKQTRN